MLWRQQECSGAYISSPISTMPMVLIKLVMLEGNLNLVIFHLGIARHLEEYGCMAYLCNVQPSLPFLTPPPSYFSTLPPTYSTLLPSPPSASCIHRFNFLYFNTNLECFLFVRTEWPDHSYHNENFTFNQNYPARSVSQILNSLH